MNVYLYYTILELLKVAAFLYFLQLIFMGITIALDGISKESKVFNCRKRLILSCIPFYWIIAVVHYIVNAYNKLDS